MTVKNVCTDMVVGSSNESVHRALSLRAEELFANRRPLSFLSLGQPPTTWKVRVYSAMFRGRYGNMDKAAVRRLDMTRKQYREHLLDSPLRRDYSHRS
jgi:hypothetical protein